VYIHVMTNKRKSKMMSLRMSEQDFEIVNRLRENSINVSQYVRKCLKKLDEVLSRRKGLE
jgi:predicted transcriptional regulator